MLLELFKIKIKSTNQQIRLFYESKAVQPKLKMNILQKKEAACGKTFEMPPVFVLGTNSGMPSDGKPSTNKPNHHRTISIFCITIVTTRLCQECKMVGDIYKSMITTITVIQKQSMRQKIHQALLLFLDPG